MAVRIGLLSDLQYCDRPNGHNFEQTRTRFYRGTVRHLERALAAWGARSTAPDVDLIVNLGDTIDGFCGRHGQTAAALGLVKALLDGLRVPVFHVLGNHELYNLPRAGLLDSWLFAGVRALVPAAARDHQLCYYALAPRQGFRLLVLDAYDDSCLGRQPGDPRFDAAMALLRRHNANDDLNDPSGLARPEFVRFNGGVGRDQLRWIEKELEEAREAGERAIVLSHIPIDVCCSYKFLLLWNWQEVSAMLSRYHDTVRLVLCGHTHIARQGRDAAGIPHVALPGLIETPDSDCGVGILELSDTAIRLIGGGGLIDDLTVELT